MPLLAPRPLVAFACLVYAGIGLWTLIDPLGALGAVGVTVADPRGVVELRAMYGGLELGMAAFLAWCLATDQERAGLVAATLTIGGLGAVRLVGLATTAEAGGLHLLLCAVELLGAAAGVYVLRRRSRAPPTHQPPSLRTPR